MARMVALVRKPLARLAIVTALVCCGFTGAASAQSIAEVLYPTPMPPESSRIFTQRMVPEDRGYDGAWICAIPAGTYGVITVAKESSQPAANEFEVADKFSTDGAGHIVSVQTDVITRGNVGDKPVVLFIPPSLDPLSHYLIYHAKDKNPASFKIYCDNVNLVAAFGWAGLRTLITAAISGTDLQTSDNTNRALNLVLSIISNGDNVLAIGLDAAREEVAIRLNKQFPNNPMLVNFTTDLFSNIMQSAYKHAFYEMSPHVLAK